MSGGVNILAVLGKVSSSVVLCLHCLVHINAVSINDVQICKDIAFFFIQGGCRMQLLWFLYIGKCLRMFLIFISETYLI